MNIEKMTLTERIQEFQSYFDAMLEANKNGLPYPLDKDILIQKAQEFNLPVPYRNENGDYVIDWNGFE